MQVQVEQNFVSSLKWGEQLSIEVEIYVGEELLSHQTELATATTWPSAE